MRTVIMMAALLGALLSCAAPTPAEHRAEVEELLGHPVADWLAWRSAAEHRCTLDRAAFERALAERAHGRVWLTTETDVRILCPRRLQEVTDWYRAYGPIR